MWSPERVTAIHEAAQQPMVSQTTARLALDCSRMTIHRMINDGRLRAYKPVSGHRMVSANSVLSLVRADIQECERAGVSIPDNLPLVVLFRY
jgi:excisionase family DNA binding protein